MATLRLQIESVQRKFLKFAAFKLQMHCPSHDYSPVQRHLYLMTLSDRITQSNLSFFVKSFNDLIDAPELLNCINFRVPVYNA